MGSTTKFTIDKVKKIWYNRVENKSKEIYKMEKTIISRGAGYEVYRVTKGFKGLTYHELAAKIDPYNWGYDVRLVTPEYVDIKIYID